MVVVGLGFLDWRQARMRWRVLSCWERERCCSMASIWSKTKFMRAEREVGFSSGSGSELVSIEGTDENNLGLGVLL